MIRNLKEYLFQALDGQCATETVGAFRISQPVHSEERIVTGAIVRYFTEKGMVVCWTVPGHSAYIRKEQQPVYDLQVTNAGSTISVRMQATSPSPPEPATLAT